LLERATALKGILKLRLKVCLQNVGKKLALQNLEIVYFKYYCVQKFAPLLNQILKQKMIEKSMEFSFSVFTFRTWSQQGRGSCWRWM
jgi:hypothetical protein